MKKVISLVPSITETLIVCGVQVVARTGFCFYPENKVASIPIIGGTKNLNTKKLSEIEYDYVILDKEENTLPMFAKAGVQSIVIHIQSINDATAEFAKLGKLLLNNHLIKVAEDYQMLVPQKRDLQSIPGIIRWWRRPTNEQRKKELKYIYVIWDKPMMAISQNSYIDSVFQLFGLSDLNKIRYEKNKYPQIEDQIIDENTILLFSTEPYLFANKRDEMLQRFPGIPMALIDAELYSWYGIRSLNIIQQEQQKFLGG